MEKPTTDEGSLVLHSDQSIPQLLPDSLEIDECYEIKIENAYDPSKFWLILKFQELALFMGYLKDFYKKAENRRSINRSNLKKDLVCIVFRNNKYYRSVVQPTWLPDTSKIRVFMIDYGLIANVPLDSIFYMFKKHCKVPRFSLRASLADIAPYGGNKMWSQTDLKSFCALIDRRQLLAKICLIDTNRHILFVDVRVYCGTMCKSVSASMISMNIADYCKISDNTKTENFTKYKPKVKYLYLCPTFEAIEGGIVPCSIWEHDLLKNAVPLDVLYKNYYEYHDVGDGAT